MEMSQKKKKNKREELGKSKDEFQQKEKRY